MKKGYLAVASLKPEKDNIERALFDYNETSPWFSQEAPPIVNNRGAQGAQTEAPAAPATTNVSRPQGVPVGSMWSGSARMWKSPSNEYFDASGRKVNQ
jgi:hypothetical protein